MLFCRRFVFSWEVILVIIAAATVERGICFHYVVRLLQNDPAVAAGPFWSSGEMEVRMTIVEDSRDKGRKESFYSFPDFWELFFWTPLLYSFIETQLIRLKPILFILYFLLVLGIELRASHMLGQHSKLLAQ